MEPLRDLLAGLEILEPFLSCYGFVFDHFENGKGSGGQFTNAFYVSGDKTFTIGYRFCIMVLEYDYKQSKIGHTVYLDCLGFKSQRRFPSAQSDDSLVGFRNVLHDLEFLIPDFFSGSCVQLEEAAAYNALYTAHWARLSQLEFNKEPDRRAIFRAREYFQQKNFVAALDIYCNIKHEDVLSDVDRKMIQYCKKHGGK